MPPKHRAEWNLFYANLSGMLQKKANPADFESPVVTRAANSAAEAPAAGGEQCLIDAGLEAAGVDHHCRICPTCGNQLTGHRCKLICTQCGYYLSCADYY